MEATSAVHGQASTEPHGAVVKRIGMAAVLAALAIALAPGAAHSTGVVAEPRYDAVAFWPITASDGSTSELQLWPTESIGDVTAPSLAANIIERHCSGGMGTELFVVGYKHNPRGSVMVSQNAASVDASLDMTAFRRTHPGCDWGSAPSSVTLLGAVGALSIKAAWQGSTTDRPGAGLMVLRPDPPLNQDCLPFAVWPRFTHGANAQAQVSGDALGVLDAPQLVTRPGTTQAAGIDTGVFTGAAVGC
jgi:hypothetical protein